MDINLFSKHLQSLSINELANLESSNDCYQIHFVQNGSGSIVTSTKKMALVAPCMLCLDEKTLIDIEQSAVQDLQMHSIYFNPILINPLFSTENLHNRLEQLKSEAGLDMYWLIPFLENKGMQLFGPGTANRLLELFRDIRQELTRQEGSFWPCRSRSHLYELLNIIAHGFETPDKFDVHVPSNLDPDVHNAIVYMNSNFHQKINIQNLVSFLGTNRTSLADKFQKALQKSAITYLAELRIRMACLFLRDTSLPIVEIMQRVGFEDSSHFGRTFRKQTGRSPSQYREDSKKGKD